VPIPRQELDSERHMLGLFCVLSELMCEEIVRFVDIDEIVDHHCLNFLFVIRGKEFN
jgi:hypothetical protein